MVIDVYLERTLHGYSSTSDERLRLQFEAVAKLDRKERDAVQTLIDGVLLMHDAKRYTARASG